MTKKKLTTMVLVATCAAAQAGDWPLWRYDAARSAASPDEIATNLTLLWSRKLPPVRSAWPLEEGQRLNFDASYEPVVMGKSLFLGSPNCGTVTAYDTESGEERWKFYTEGPVRCAPACWRGKVYAGSDDGYLYCFDAQSGKLLWKFRGAPAYSASPARIATRSVAGGRSDAGRPADRPDRRQIGNGHLVSFWPVRGGPVVVNGVVCFAAGVWSIHGVFVHGLDAETGQVKWTNSDLHYFLTRAGGRFVESGVSPQGHLVAIRDRLVVPNGRAMPAGLELATGKLVYYLPGARGGDSRVVAHGEYAYVGKERLVNLYDFREAGSRWAYKGAQPPPGYFDSPAWQDWVKMGPGVQEMCFLQYKTVEGCDASAAFADGVAYGLAKGTCYAYDVAKARTVEGDRPSDHGTYPGLKWEPPLLWQFKTPYEGQEGNLVIKAGKRLYGRAGKKLLALENLKSAPRMAWEKDMDGKPSSMIAADNKLFVATAEGGLYCFGEAGAAAAAAKTYEYQAAPLEPKNGIAGAKAQEIVKVSGVKSGYCLVLGLTDGRLVEELLRQTELLIIAVDSDAKKIEALRRRCDSAGLLGSRVELFTAKPFEFLFPPYLASLIVSEDALAGGFSSKTEARKLFEILHPYGGTLCLELPPKDRPAFERWAKGAGLANGMVKDEGGWSLLAREGALPGSAPWTHDAADAARTFCSQDDLVKAPLGILWYGDMPNLALWKANPVRAQVNGGRVYVLKQHSRSVELMAYDAYTGRFLWRTDAKPTTYGNYSCFSAQADGLYVVMDGQCMVCDPATGNVLKNYTFNATGAKAVKDLRVDDDIILVACSEVKEEDIDKDYWRQGAYDSSTLVCLDRKTGAELWRQEAKDRFNNSSIVLGGGRVFCVDSIPGWQSAKWKQRRADLKELESTVLALNSKTGKEVWSTIRKYENKGGGDACRDLRLDGIVNDEWLAYSAEAGVVLGGRPGLAHAWDAKTGKLRWENKKVDPGPIIVRGQNILGMLGKYAGTRWSEVTYDISTGEDTGKPGVLQGFGCNTPLGGRHLLTQRVGSASYLDIDQGKLYYLRNIRPGCVNGMFAADGLMNAPSMGTGCICSYSLLTSFAMATMPEVAAWAGTTPLKITPPPAKPVPETSPK